MMPAPDSKIDGLANLLADAGTLHHIHAPGEDGPDDPGADPRWKAAIEACPSSRKLLEDMRDVVGWHEVLPPPTTIITTPAIRDRYRATLERLARERNEAAFEWTRLHWWQWRKRRRLWRVLFGLGGWRMDGVPEIVPHRVIPRRRLPGYRVLEP
jgi:hypothetical protein